MQKYFTLFLLFNFFVKGLFAQSCLPEGIAFNSQAGIDSFPVHYPGCTEIEGDVFIQGDDISNLDGLIGLTSLGGSLVVGWDWLEYFYTNHELVSLKGLDNLHSIAGDLRILNNYSLTNLTGLENLSSVTGDLIISYNYSLESMSGLESLSSIGGYIFIGSNDALTTLAGLVGDGLSSLEGDLYISSNDALISLAGLDSLHSIQGNLSISNNKVLVSLAGLDSLHSIQGNLSIGSNHALTSLSGLGGLFSVGGYFSISYNDGLTSLDGLENLFTVGGKMLIQNNDALPDLSGFPASLSSLGGDLDIEYNDALTTLTGAEGISSIGGDLIITGNPLLTSLQGLTGLSFVNKTIDIRNNEVLPSLDGLENIDHHSFEYLRILNCSILSDCAVKSVCDHLQNGGDANIMGNAYGCSIIFEVMAACEVAVDEAGSGDSPVRIFPNPTGGIVRIEDSTHSHWNVIIRDVIGNAVFSQSVLGNEQLDLSALPSGVYLFEMRNGEQLVMHRILKR